MEPRLIVTPADYTEYFLRLYFGPGSDPLTGCIERAYLDFSRTLHGLSKLAETTRRLLFSDAKATLRRAIVRVGGDHTCARSQTGFDVWHRAVCRRLIAMYDNRGHHLYVGQAQKWVNMALKYIFAHGESRLPGYRRIYHLCHVPLDQIVLNRLRERGLPPLSAAWSRLDSYEEYLDRQTWVRDHFSLVP